jgi:pimeloyl-ACP methyl ester carboxylesterase
MPVAAAVMLLAATMADAPAHVTFDTADHGRISADVYGEGTDVVILAHGAGGNKSGWTPLAEALVEKGHRVIAFDFRGTGESTRGDETFALYLDVLAAIRYARANGATRVGVLGSSLGGRAASEAAIEGKPGEIDRLFLLSPAWAPNAAQMHAGRYLYVVSKWEEMFQDVKEQFERTPEPKRLEIMNESAHAQRIFQTEEGPRLKALVIEFFAPQTPPK